MNCRISGLGSLLALTAPAHASTQIVSYVETSGSVHSDPVVTGKSGKVVYQDANGAYNRAVTAVGTNKVYSSGNGTSELNAGSAWMDSYTVQGSGTVNVSLSFTVDGTSNVGANLGGDGNPFDWTYRVLALKGDNWNLTGQGTIYSAPNGIWPIRTLGDNYESLLLTRASPADATVTQTLQPRFATSTFWNVRNFGEQPGEFVSGYSRNGNNVTLSLINGNDSIRRTYSSTRVTTTVNDGTPQTVLYGGASDPNRVAYAKLLADHPILGQTGLCQIDDNGLCPGIETYGPTTMTLNFSLAAGEKFTVLSYLSHINLRDGEFDFFNTAKLSGITVSPGASLISGSGQLQQLAGGGYGYAPLTLGVPEPANWALMIGGFGLIGGASRRRQRQAANTASNAVAAPRVG